MTIGATAQLRRITERARFWSALADPFDSDDDLDTRRLSLDIRAKDYAWFEQVAAFRNALAAAQNKKLRRQKSRKSEAERALAAHADFQREQFRELIEACGPIPNIDPKHPDEMEKYARRVLAWEKKTNSGK